MFAAAFGFEAGDGGSDVACSEFGRRIDGAREKTLAERAERDEPDAEFAERGQHLGLGVACPQGVLALHRRDREGCVRSPNGGGGRLRKSEMGNFSLFDQLSDCSGDVFDGYRRIDPMLVKEIDGIGAEASEGFLRDAADLLGAAVEPDARAAFDAPAEFRRDDDLVANGL